MSIFNKIIKKADEIANSEKAKNLRASLEDATENLVNTSKKAINDVKENENFQKAMDTAKDKIGEIKESPITKKIVHKTKEATEAASETLTELGDKAMENQTFRNTVKTVKSKTNEFIENPSIKEAIDSTKNMAEDLGKKISKSLNSDNTKKEE